MTWESTFATECASCGAKPGHPCTSRNGLPTQPPHASRRRPEDITTVNCPECGSARRDEETLRVHRILAHHITQEAR